MQVCYDDNLSEGETITGSSGKMSLEMFFKDRLLGLRRMAVLLHDSCSCWKATIDHDFLHQICVISCVKPHYFVLRFRFHSSPSPIDSTITYHKQSPNSSSDEPHTSSSLNTETSNPFPHPNQTITLDKLKQNPPQSLP